MFLREFAPNISTSEFSQHAPKQHSPKAIALCFKRNSNANNDDEPDNTKGWKGVPLDL